MATAQPVQRVRKINEGFATKVVEQKNEDAEKTFREELDRIAKEAAIKRQEEELVALARTDRLDIFENRIKKYSARIKKIEDYTQESMD